MGARVMPGVRLLPFEVSMVNLHNRTMYVSATANHGVVNAGTRHLLFQRGSRVVGKYAGGNIQRGCLVGRVSGATLHWHYLQREQSGELHAGRAVCDLIEQADGCIRIIEHFQWKTRDGRGTNVFDELPQHPLVDQ